MSYEQDLKRKGIEETNYQRDFERECEHIAELESTADGFIQNLYEDMSDEDIKELWAYLENRNYVMVFYIMKKYADKYVIREAEFNLS